MPTNDSNSGRGRQISSPLCSPSNRRSWRDEMVLIFSQNTTVELLISELLVATDPLARLPEPGAGFSLEEYVASARKQLILRALEMADGNQSAAARLLGISPQAVHKFLTKSRE